VGHGNYDRVMSAMFAAVPSQSADDFPADLIFKKRERRKDVAKSFTLKGGLQTLTDALAAAPGVQVVTGATAAAITKQGGAFAVTTADGLTFLAPQLALALPPSQGARLMADVAPDLSTALATFDMAPVESVGVVVPSDATPLGPMAFLVAARDTFYSAVTRDTVPDPAWRSFSFHFKAQTPEAERLEQIRAILQVDRAKVAHVASRRVVLPSPRLGHEVRVAAVERALAAASGLAVVGNYFAGLALEDCVLRAKAESDRLSATTS
jgi:protoporphyrinogen oxidase